MLMPQMNKQMRFQKNEFADDVIPQKHRTIVVTELKKKNSRKKRRWGR